jgi:hypothetical protein
LFLHAACVQRSDSQYADAARRDGWQNQANHLTVIHTMVGKAAMIVAGKVRRLPSLKWARCQNPTPSTEFERGLETGKNELANELEQTRAKLAERDATLIHAKQWIEYLAERGAKLEQQVPRETAAPQILKEHVEALTEQSAAANKPVAKLEGELATAREELVLWENKNRSLQTSLNWIVSENVRLSNRLTEVEAAIDEANKKRQTETNTLKSCLEAMSTRALTAEKLLEEVRQSLLAGTEEKHAAEHKVVDITSGRDTVDNKLRQLQNSLLIKVPFALVNPPDTKVDLVKILKKITALDFRLQRELEKHAVSEDAREKPRTNCAEPHGELDNHVEHNGKHSERANACHTQMLLGSILAS